MKKSKKNILLFCTIAILIITSIGCICLFKKSIFSNEIYGIPNIKIENESNPILIPETKPSENDETLNDTEENVNVEKNETSENLNTEFVIETNKNNVSNNSSSSIMEDSKNNINDNLSDESIKSESENDENANLENDEEKTENSDYKNSYEYIEFAKTHPFINADECEDVGFSIRIEDSNVRNTMCLYEGYIDLEGWKLVIFYIDGSNYVYTTN